MENCQQNRVKAIETGLKGMRAGKLRKALGLTSGEAHHIIPVQLLKENDVVQDAVAAGFDFNGIQNGIKALKNHGPHSKYTESIRKAIGDWKNQNPDYTPEQAKAFIESLAGNIKKQISKTNGNVKSLNK